jgi:hypothetical protein
MAPTVTAPIVCVIARHDKASNALGAARARSVDGRFSWRKCATGVELPSRDFSSFLQWRKNRRAVSAWLTGRAEEQLYSTPCLLRSYGGPDGVSTPGRERTRGEMPPARLRPVTRPVAPREDPRGNMRRRIVALLQEHPEGLTSAEMRPFHDLEGYEPNFGYPKKFML